MKKTEQPEQINRMFRAFSEPTRLRLLRLLLGGEMCVGDLVAVLRQEILAVVNRHVSVDPDKVQVKVDRGAKVSTLEVDIEFPNAGASAAHA